jgi:hypothetical protein
VDRYSKVILTIIMFLLIVFLLKPGLIFEVKANSGITDVNIVQVDNRYISRGIPVEIIK